MKAKAAQIERISTLIAEVIDEPSRSSDETFRVRIGKLVLDDFIYEDLMNCKVYDSPEQFQMTGATALTLGIRAKIAHFACMPPFTSSAC
jgi:hypothetical protein